MKAEIDIRSLFRACLAYAHLDKARRHDVQLLPWFIRWMVECFLLAIAPLLIGRLKIMISFEFSKHRNQQLARSAQPLDKKTGRATRCNKPHGSHKIRSTGRQTMSFSRGSLPPSHPPPLALVLSVIVSQVIILTVKLKKTVFPIRYIGYNLSTSNPKRGRINHMICSGR